MEHEHEKGPNVTVRLFDKKPTLPHLRRLMPNQGAPTGKYLDTPRPSVPKPNCDGTVLEDVGGDGGTPESGSTGSGPTP
ncbi:MAG: hypothetical protein KAT71_05630 [Gammaproteobacteria bacterium]|nr:hypothetical protein [Gammaproteobacteria bacterium]